MRSFVAKSLIWGQPSLFCSAFRFCQLARCGGGGLISTAMIHSLLEPQRCSMAGNWGRCAGNVSIAPG